MADDIVVPEKMVTLGEIATSTEPSSSLQQTEPTTLAEAYRSSLDKAYPNLKLSQEGARKVRSFVQNLRSGGSAGVLLICAGDACEFKAACPLYKEQAAPVGEVCPLEAMVVMDTRAQLGTLVDLNTDNPITRGYINELTQVAVLTWRCQMKLAYDFHDMLQMVPAAIGPDAVVHHKPEASPLVDLLDKLSSRRSRLLKELALTEDAKWRKEAALGDQKKDSLSRAQSAKKAALQQQQGILPTVIEPPAHVLGPRSVSPSVVPIDGATPEKS